MENVIKDQHQKSPVKDIRSCTKIKWFKNHSQHWTEQCSNNSA